MQIHLVRIALYLLTLQTAFSSFACKTLSKVTSPQSTEKGLSATANADNVALFMTAYASTPQHGSLFETDLNQFHEVVTDPDGNYRFKTMVERRVGHYQMLANIRSASQQVSDQGTLLIFLAAHGANNGQIQPDDQRYVTIGYPEVLQAIREGRNGKPFRRLVLFVSACFSGSWLQNLESSEGLIKERLVITSVGANQMSWIAQATRGMLQAFQQIKDQKDATLQSLISQARYNVGDIIYNADPESMMSEALVNPSGTTSKPNEDTNDTTASKPSSDKPPSETPDQPASKLGRLKAITQADRRGGVQLYVYSETEVTRIEMSTGNGWWQVSDQYLPQPGFISIYGTWANQSWAREQDIKLRLTLPSGTQIEQTIDIEHR